MTEKEFQLAVKRYAKEVWWKCPVTDMDPLGLFLSLQAIYGPASGLMRQDIVPTRDNTEPVFAYWARIAASQYPAGWSSDRWEFLVSACCYEFFGPKQVRVSRKRPKGPKLEAAKTMTANEMVKKLGISRSYAYKLRAEAIEKK